MVENKDQPAIVVLEGQTQTEVIKLSQLASIGRQPSNEIVIAEKEVSRRHAEIRKTAEGYVVRDLGSTNGTFVNQQKIPAGDYLLKDGDEIRLGASVKVMIYRTSTPPSVPRLPAVARPPEPLRPAEPAATGEVKRPVQPMTQGIPSAQPTQIGAAVPPKPPAPAAPATGEPAKTGAIS